MFIYIVFLLILVKCALAVQNNNGSSSEDIKAQPGKRDLSSKQAAFLSGKKLLPLWPDRRCVTMSPVAKKILNMSAVVNDLLKDEQQRMAEIKAMRESMGKSKQAIMLIENRCNHREESLSKSREKNMELLTKLLTFVKEKDRFDDTLRDELHGIYTEFRPLIHRKPVKKKSTIPKSFIFLIPQPEDYQTTL